MSVILNTKELDKLKYQIENESELKPQYWVKLGYRGSHTPTEDIALRDLVRWSIGVCKDYDVHMKPWVGVETNPDIRIHLHVIVSPNNSLPISIFDSWYKRHGDFWVDKYDPSRGAVYYQWFKHQYEEVQVICPRKISSCRKKRCRYLLHNL